MKQNTITTDFYTIIENRVRFTDEGINELQPLFAKSGIDIHTIKTSDQLKKAYNACDLGAHFLDIAYKGKQTLERQLLIATLENNNADAKRLAFRIQQKKHMKVIT